MGFAFDEYEESEDAEEVAESSSNDSHRYWYYRQFSMGYEARN